MDWKKAWHAIEPYKSYLTAAAIIVAMGASAYLGFYFADSRWEDASSVRMPRAEHSFTNPLLDYEEPRSPLMRNELHEMEYEVGTIVDTAKSRGDASQVSVYYRDLDNGPWMSVGDQEFSPASLLKVPLMITFFKMAERDPSILDRKVPYLSRQLAETHRYLTDDSQLLIGKTYTIEELIFHMIAYSDNEAMALLNANVDVEEQKKVYTDFDEPLPNNANPRQAFIKAHEYAGFLRILYNATYLNQEYSERALEIMSHSTFKQGIRAGVDSNIRVSNKFGVYENGNGEVQLHDCGIVYDQKTYIICVMTLGKNTDVLANVIRDISKVIYDRNRSSWN